MTEALTPESVRVAAPIYLDMVDARVEEGVVVFTGALDVLVLKFEHAARGLRALQS